MLPPGLEAALGGAALGAAVASSSAAPFFCTCLLWCSKLYSSVRTRNAGPDAVRSVGIPMHVSLPGQPPLPQAVVDSALRRLGDWESNVDRPSWTVPNQQLGLSPPGPDSFTVHVDTPEQILRFQGVQPERSFWLEHLPNIDPDIMRLSRFRQCGAYAWVAQDVQTGRYFLRGESCKMRICPVCRRNIQRRSADRVLDFMHIRGASKWQFITLTLKHSENPLKTQLDRLVRCFRKLRQRKLWRDSVQTGYAVIEVTFHAADSVAPGGRLRAFSEWHPHLHVVAQTEWIDWSALRKAWFAVTGDSDNIDCQKVESSSHAAHYVSKYIGKPPDINLRSDPRHAAEYYRSLQHRRLLMPFGPAAKHQPPPRAPLPVTQKVCKFSALLTSAAGGNYPAQCMLACIILGTVPRPIVHQNRQEQLFNRGPP